jgi:hypothetical protein
MRRALRVFVFLAVGLASVSAATREPAPSLGSVDFQALQKMLQRLADNPPGANYPKWSRIAQAGADSARNQDVQGVKRSCRDCHDAYKEAYKREFPSRVAHPRPTDNGYLAARE